MFRAGANSSIGTITRELVDEENEGAETIAKRALGLFLLLLDDLLKALLHLTRLDQLGGNLVVDEIRRDHRAHGTVCISTARLVGDPELGAHLGRRAGGIHTVEHPLPKAEADRKQGIVRDIRLVIAREMLREQRAFLLAGVS